MRNLEIINFITLLLLTLFLSNCTKNVVEDKQQKLVEEELQEQGMRLANPEIFERNGIVYPLNKALHVSCGDNPCTGSTTDNCTVAWDLKNNTAECSCSGCKMTLSSKEYHGDLDYQSMINNELEFAKAKAFVKENYEILIDGFNEIELHFNEKFTVGIYKFEMPNGQIESFIVQTEYNKFGKTLETIIVDCTGACNGQVIDGCTEVYDIKNGTVSCSCEGCKMKVDKS